MKKGVVLILCILFILSSFSIISSSFLSKESFDFEYLIQNGDPEDKFDILFIPFNISSDAFHDAIDNMLYSAGKTVSNEAGNIYSRGLFKIEPFESNSYRFNIEFSEKELTLGVFDCYYKFSSYSALRSKPFLSCDWNKLKQSLNFEPDIIVVVGKDFSTNAGGGIIIMGDPLSGSADPEAKYSDAFVHEFGHSFGGLTDEYAYPFTYNCNEGECYYVSSPDPCVDSEDPACFSNLEDNLKIIPNEDVLGCPKWCEDYNKTKLNELSEECTDLIDMESCIIGGCVWYKQKHPWFDANCIPRKIWEGIGINCISQCIFGHHYTHIGFSPHYGEGGMMFNMVGDFNPPSLEHLSTALECCFPKNNSIKCKEFSDKFKNLPEEINPYFKISYNKFAGCYNEGVLEDSANKSTNISEQKNDSSILVGGIGIEEVLCNGCKVGEVCYPVGYIKSKKYCSEDGIFIDQIEKGSCENSFECSSNVCVNNECVTKNFLQKILDFFRKLLGKE